MQRIKIGLKGLAKFMAASASGQRKVLRDYKYPDEEGTAQAVYYRDARDFISVYHREGHAAEWLREKADLLTAMGKVLGGRVGTRLQHNARALNEYSANFPAKKLEVLPERKFFVVFGDVRISVVPDLHVRLKDREQFMKLEFSVKEPVADSIRVITQTMFEAATAAQIPVRSGDVVYLDIARGNSYKGARVGAKMRGEIEAACKNIAAMWEGI